MKKVAFVLKGYPRISETFIAQEIHQLEQRGFTIEILSLRQARESERQPVVDQIRAPVTYLPEYIRPNWRSALRENLRCFGFYPGRYVFALGQTVGQIVKTRSLRPARRFFQAGWAVGHRRLGCDPDGVQHLHAHFAHTPTEVALHISRITGLPFSISAHAKDIYTLSPAEIAERVRAARLLMTCTEFNWRYLRGLPGVPIDKIHRVYHGIDLQRFRRRQPLPDGPAFAESLHRFVSVGRLVEKKGFDVILAALARFKATGGCFTYDLYGTGELEDRLRQLARRLGLEAEVRFHRTATHPQIIERFQQGGLFLGGFKVTPDGDRDGIPNTVAEAMAMELPVLATNVSGVPELVEHGRSGHLVPPNNVEAYTEALLRLTADPNYCRALATGGRARVAAIFNCDCCIESCAALLRPLLAS